MMNKKKSKSGVIMGIAVLIALLLVLNVAASRMSATIAMGIGRFTSDALNEDTEYTVEGNYLDGFEASVDIMSEGTVLLKNENNILPLEDGTNVTLMGAGSYNFILGGTGSAGGKDDEYTISMYDAFSEAGLYVNDDAWNNLEYASGGTRNTRSRYGNDEYRNFTMGNTDASGWTSYQAIHEFSVDVHEEVILENGSAVGNYGEYAIVTISRSGAEGASPSMDYDGDGSTITGSTYLELSQDERDLLELCAEYFDHTIVLINSSAAMELGFIDQEEYNIDACLWIGHPGEAGLVGVGYVLTGIVNPSGALVDTYAYDMTTNPTYYNTDDNRYANANNQTFYQYEEGIYVGYRYYETADAEGYFDSSDFTSLSFKGQDGTSATSGNVQSGMVSYSGYDEVVQFPFGYGLSYTSFTQEIVSSDVALDAHGENSVTVEVTNTGSYAGKSIVQLYMEAPYQEDSSLGISGVGLEKAKVVLVGFAKTEEIEPGDSATVTIEFSTDDLASFDNFGQGCYVLEEGTYIFHVSPNAHGWANEAEYGVDYDTLTCELADTYVYNSSSTTGVAVGARDSDETIAVNAMDDVTAGDGNMLDGYLSRSDFAGGMSEIMRHQSNESPNEYASDGVVAALATTGTDTYAYTFQTYRNGVLTSVTETLYAYANNAAPWMTELPNGTSVSDLLSAFGTVSWEQTYYVVVDSADNVVYTKDSGSGVLDDFDLYTSVDEIPDDIMSMGSSARELTIGDMSEVAADDQKWDQITSMITLDEAITIQGNCGWSTPAVESVGKEGVSVNDGPAEPNNGGSDMVTWFPSAVAIASTWNEELAYDYGEAYGQWCVTLNLGGAYAPSMNIHRSPFGGRNFEYFSEDGFISGIIGGSAVSGIMSTGTSVFIKHMALNDGDTNRGGVCTWANEQAIREIYLRPYEISVKDYNADGIMGSLNRIGMSWAHYGMYTTVLRDEWGFAGHLITDGDGTTGAAYNNTVFWLAGTQGSMLNNGIYVNDDQVVANYGTSAYTSEFGQYLLHQTAKHMLYQYGTSAMVAGNYVWWWVGVLIAVDVVMALGVVALVVFNFVVPYVRGRKQKQIPASPNAGGGTIE